MISLEEPTYTPTSMELHDRSGKLCDVDVLNFHDLHEQGGHPWLSLDTMIIPPHEILYLVLGDDRIPVRVNDTTFGRWGHKLSRAKVL